MGLPKVLVFTPIYEKKDYALERFLKHSKAINYPNFRHIFIDNSLTLDYYNKLKEMGLDVYHVERGNNSREALARAQNFARQIALDEDYPYIMSLESDVMVPPQIIQLLLQSGKDVISGLYLIGSNKLKYKVPCITIPEWDKTIGAWGTRLLKPHELKDYLHKGLKRVQAAGMGCCLIYKNAFKDVSFTYDPRFTGHSDVYFFNTMFEKKIPVWVNTDILCDHDNSEWLDVDDR